MGQSEIKHGRVKRGRRRPITDRHQLVFFFYKEKEIEGVADGVEGDQRCSTIFLCSSLRVRSQQHTLHITLLAMFVQRRASAINRSAQLSLNITITIWW